MEFRREKRIATCKETSYFYNLDVYELLPDDFKIEVSYEGNPLSELFQKITSLLSLCFIATTAAFNGSEIKGIIHGQRIAEYSCLIDDLKNNKIFIEYMIGYIQMAMRWIRLLFQEI